MIDLLLLYIIPWIIIMVAAKIIIKTKPNPRNIEFAGHLVVYAFIPALNLLAAGLMIFGGCGLVLTKIKDYVVKNM